MPGSARSGEHQNDLLHQCYPLRLRRRFTIVFRLEVLSYTYIIGLIDLRSTDIVPVFQRLLLRMGLPWGLAELTNSFPPLCMLC